MENVSLISSSRCSMRVEPPSNCSMIMIAFAARWGMPLCFNSAHTPTGNGIVEHNHHTVKVISTRKQCSITGAVQLCNVMPYDWVTVTEAAASGIYYYEVLDCVLPAWEQGPRNTVTGSDESKEYMTGDTVWIRQCGSTVLLFCNPASSEGPNRHRCWRSIVTHSM